MNRPTETKHRTVAEIDGFISLLLAACEDQKMNDALANLLALPDQKRRAFVHGWLADLLIQQAPTKFIEAIACLLDDAVAERAYEVIFQCRRQRGRAV